MFFPPDHDFFKSMLRIRSLAPSTNTSGAGANAVKYNPKYNELYVTNFTSGTISVVDATKYSITREFNMPVYPNQMVLSDDMDTLYIGIKEGFNRDWDPDVFVEGAKERILSIDLKKS